LIAVTEGPGLIPALLIGANAAKTLAYIWKKPLIGIHHIEGHIAANFIRGISNFKFPISNKDKIKFPALCLVVSGGHTQLMYMKKNLSYQIIGETLDDAAGEAFDKVARILGLGYPGGPAIARRAMKFKFQSLKFKVQLPRPMLNSNNFNFSFSGLKTAVLYETKKHLELLKDKNYIATICREFQQAAIDVLVAKTIKAAKKYNPKTIMLAGGVSANKELRKQLKAAVKKNLPPTACYILPATYSIDNAAMIASAAHFRWKNLTTAQKKKASQFWKTLEPDANLKLK
jgi:N6-L-threonylcarbamoyladenine synthase